MIHRHLTERLLVSLRDTPVVYLQGARQTGKSTLARAIAAEHHPARYLSLDTAAVLAAAENDPAGFVEGLERPVVVDEVQRVPGLALAIKSAVDADRRPGQFLLTGSASALAVPRICESFVGRVDLHTLWPFSQGEIAEHRESFLDALFAAELELPEPAKLTEADLLHRMAAGGYPEALARKKDDRRQAWFGSYLTTILQRDVRDLAHIEKLAEVPRLLALVASRVGGLINYSDLARSVGIPQTTLKRYMALLEATFLVRPLPAWYANVGKRLVKSPKLLLTDTGLVAHLLDLDLHRLRSDRVLLGHVLENFVAMELTKQLGWSKTHCRMYHFRAENGLEVDLVLEDRSGRIVGVEVKSTSGLRAAELRGLKMLAEACGDRFLCGVVLYLGAEMVPLARNLWAVPVEALWT